MNGRNATLLLIVALGCSPGAGDGAKTSDTQEGASCPLVGTYEVVGLWCHTAEVAPNPEIDLAWLGLDSGLLEITERSAGDGCDVVVTYLGATGCEQVERWHIPAPVEDDQTTLHALGIESCSRDGCGLSLAHGYLTPCDVGLHESTSAATLEWIEEDLLRVGAAPLDRLLGGLCEPGDTLIDVRPI